MYETGAKGLAKVGWIRKIQQRGAEFRIHFEFDERFPPLTAKRIKDLEWDLSLSDWEKNRTHWAVKDGDLLEILGLRKVQPASTIHDAVDKFAENDQTLETLISEIQRGMRENRHGESLDPAAYLLHEEICAFAEKAKNQMRKGIATAQPGRHVYKSVGTDNYPARNK